MKEALINEKYLYQVHFIGGERRLVRGESIKRLLSGNENPFVSVKGSSGNIFIRPEQITFFEIAK